MTSFLLYVAERTTDSSGSTVSREYTYLSENAGDRNHSSRVVSHLPCPNSSEHTLIAIPFAISSTTKPSPSDIDSGVEQVFSAREVTVNTDEEDNFLEQTTSKLSTVEYILLDIS
jgi:hypothetical protein